MTSTPAPRKVAVCGGRTTWDAFDSRLNPDYGRWYEVVDTRPDYLIVDFFGDVQDDGGDPEAYFAQWTERLAEFAGYVAEHVPEVTVIVHRGFYADTVATGPTDRPRELRSYADLEAVDVPRRNELWARLDEHAVSMYGWASIDLTQDGYTSSTDHPQGPFWVHYSPDYYHRFLAELHAIDLAQRLPGAASTVTQIVDSGRERIATQEAFLRRAVPAQGELLGSLEHRGLGRAVLEITRRKRGTR